MEESPRAGEFLFSAGTVAAAGAEELRAVAESYASTAGAGRPRGLGIFVPPHEERHEQG